MSENCYICSANICSANQYSKDDEQALEPLLKDDEKRLIKKFILKYKVKEIKSLFKRFNNKYEKI